MAVQSIRIREVGRVREVRKVIARVSDLTHFMNGQLVTFSSGGRGMIVGFNQGDIMVLILGEEAKVRVGDQVYGKLEEFKIPVGEQFIGRIINALGEPYDGRGPIEAASAYPVFREAPQTMDRGDVDGCLETGTKIIDAIVPIAKGQRQLVIGDRMTGKTTVALDTILNQKGGDVICIYCCIGKSFSSLVKVVQLFKQRGALEYTIVLAATASMNVGEQYLAPYSASALGEYFMYKGKDVLLVFDDMTKHSWSYRELSLLLERPPGREAYPGDIYYVHSQLVERAGKLSKELGGGSMTSLPIVDTLQGDVTGFIPSNLISMTDGQVYLSADLFAEGFKPAIDFGMSVSIIGSKVQSPAIKQLTATLRIEYANYKELLRLTKLKAGLSADAERRIRRGDAMSELLTQDKNSPVSLEELIVLLYALDRKILDELNVKQCAKFKSKIWEYINRHHPGVVRGLREKRDLTDEIKAELDKAFVEFFKEEGK